MRALRDARGSAAVRRAKRALDHRSPHDGAAARCRRRPRRSSDGRAGARPAHAREGAQRPPCYRGGTHRRRRRLRVARRAPTARLAPLDRHGSVAVLARFALIATFLHLALSHLGRIPDPETEMPTALAQDFAADVRFAVKQMRRRKSFTATVVLTLGLGIGATVALLSVVNALFLRPLAFPHEDRVRVFWMDY